MPVSAAPPVVTGVARDGGHRFSKRPAPSIRLLAGIGVEGDAHAGRTVQHRSRLARDPQRPNLRQVHLLPAELQDELRHGGFRVGAGELGENLTTRGIELLGLPAGARLGLGADAVVEVTGLRNPCRQIDGLQSGLLAAVLGRDERGNVVRRAGIMAVVPEGGVVRPGDRISVALPTGPHRALRAV